MHHGRKMKIAAIEINEIQWGDPRAILKVQVTIAQCSCRDNKRKDLVKES
jgi:hypothetical protein